MSILRRMNLLNDSAVVINPATEEKQNEVIANQTDGTQLAAIQGTQGATFVQNPDGHMIIDFDTNEPSHDAFGRLRVSMPETLLDLKQTRDNLPLFYDDSEVSGSGTTSTHSVNTSTTTMGVAETTAGHRVRQSKLWGNYQPGKSQFIALTFADMVSTSGVRKMAGYFWDRWGIYFKHEDGVANIGIRTYNTGSAVDEDVIQSNWNLDTFDGSGDSGNPSGILIDFSKTLIWVTDYQWLGVGRVRVGFEIGGTLYYAHEFLHANLEDEVFMSNPNSPIRYEIKNDGTGAASTMSHICATIMSEGGQDQTAITSYESRNGTVIALANQDIFTPVLSFRKKSTAPCTKVNPIDISVVLTTNTNYEWALFLNPTIAGTDAVSWTSVTNSSLEYDISRTNANTPSGGLKLTGGYGSSSNQVHGIAGQVIESFLGLGMNIDMSMDELVLGVKNVDGNGGNCYAGMTFSEYC